MTGGEEVGMKGVDGEIGFRLPTEYLSINPNIFELRAYGGGYHFYSDDAEDNVTGVKGRLELRVNDVIASLPGSRLTVDYEVSHDDVRDTRHDVGLRVRIPLNAGKPARSLASLSGQQRRMLDGVERHTDIVTGRSKAHKVEDALTGTDFDRVAYADDTTDVTETSNSAGDNSLIIVNGKVTGGQELQGNQTLLGGGKTILVRHPRSGVTLPFTAPGAAGSLTEAVGINYSLTLLGSNTHVSGLTIVGNSTRHCCNPNDGIRIFDGLLNMYLTNLEISKAGGYGINVGSNNEVSVIDVNITGTGHSGVGWGGMFFDNDNQIVITGGSVNDVRGSGIQIDDRNTVSISGVTFRDTTREAINIGHFNEIKIVDVEIIDSKEEGIVIGGYNASVTLSNVSIEDVGEQGIEIGSNNELITIAGVSITTTGQDGIDIGDDNTDVTISNVTIENSGVRGIAILLNNEKVTIQNVSILDSSNAGIFIGGANDQILLDGVTINLTGDHGIEVAMPGNTIVVRNSTLSNIGQNAFHFVGNTNLLIADSIIDGTLGYVFGFDSGNFTIDPGSTGNVNTTTGGLGTCGTSGIFTIIGEIGFFDGTVVNAATCP